VPQNENSLAPEGVLSLDDVLGKVLAIVADFSPHVVDEEWLREVEFVVRVRHGLEVQRHGGTTLDIADLVAACGSVAVHIEELSDLLAVLREHRVRAALLPLLVEVHNVVGLGRENTTKFFVGEHLIKNKDFIDSRLGTLVSDAGSGDKSSRSEMELPERGVCEHHEGETTISDKSLSPHVVGAVKAGANLIKVVTSTHAPFPVVSVHNVGNVRELGGVTLSFDVLSSVGTVIRGRSTDVVTVNTAGRLEAHVVIAWLVVLAETELGDGRKERAGPLLYMEQSEKIFVRYLQSCGAIVVTFLKQIIIINP